ncbi:SAM-dependent methyltransferase [Anthropogastromicrobium sp.]|uniref:class I SAM-dependent methyltransferase n=1 Tax=Anthropogastromicrobium sp. TaxID=2981649 RepID=UPI00307C0BA5
MSDLQSLFTDCLNETLIRVILSNPSSKDGVIKICARPMLKNKSLLFQIEEYTKTQVFHKNLTAGDAGSYLTGKLSSDTSSQTASFKNALVETQSFTANVLVSKKGTITIKKKMNASAKQPKISLSHNRKKKYILEEGIPVPFLIDLGVMTQNGNIVNAHYDKFRQINRFLEYIEDILPSLPTDRELRILDFGCGKSYLTFAIYYYLKVLKGYPVRITGLDLKEDVIRHCNELAVKYGYDKLEFLCGDIAYYDGCSQVDMVVTLHACDTATDYALAKAVGWGAKVILSVPCCQHELNKQMKNDLLSPVLHYGILKERMAALMTDGLRAQILEANGYRTQILEFIDMAHTPKNLLIRAVYNGHCADNKAQINELLAAFDVNPTLYRLLCKKDNTISE